MDTPKKREQFEVKFDLEEQMRKLQRKKSLERQKRMEEGIKIRRSLFKYIVSSVPLSCQTTKQTLNTALDLDIISLNKDTSGYGRKAMIEKISKSSTETDYITQELNDAINY